MMRIHISKLPLWIAFVRAALYRVSEKNANKTNNSADLWIKNSFVFGKSRSTKPEKDIRMGSSLSRAWLSFKQRKERRCLLVGLDNAGKTCSFSDLWITSSLLIYIMQKRPCRNPSYYRLQCGNLESYEVHIRYMGTYRTG